MKILYIIHDFLPKHQAGAEIYTYLLAKEMNRKHEVLLFFTEISSVGTPYRLTRREVDGLPCIEVFRPPEAAITESPHTDRHMEKIFQQLLTDFRPDILHIQHLLYHSLQYPAIAKAMGIPTLFTLHDYWLSCPRWGQRIRRGLTLCHTVDIDHCSECLQPETGRKNLFNPVSLLRSLLQPSPKTSTPEKRFEALITRKEQVLRLSEKVDCFIAPSSFLQKTFTRYGLPPEKIVCSDNGMNTKGYTERPHAAADHIRFAFIGTISEHKGVHILIEAFNTLEQEKATLDIYGDMSWFPQYSRRLEQAVTSAAISFKGTIPNRAVADTLASIDVLVVPSIWFENSPLTIHEAFLAGVPVITSNLGGMADLVEHGVSGLLFPVNDTNGLAEAMRQIIHSDTLLDTLRKNIPPVKSIEENAEELEILYQKFRTSERPPQ